MNFFFHFLSFEACAQTGLNKVIYLMHFEITGYPCNVMALSSAIYSRIALSFALNRIFFSANENGTVKQNNQSAFKANQSHCRKMKDKKAIDVKYI